MHARCVLHLEALVDLGGRLDQQEQAAGDRIRSRHENSKRQSENSGAVSDITQVMLASRPRRMKQREREADDARAVALLRRQLVRQDGDEDQVVDAEDDLERDQRERGRPRRSDQRSIPCFNPCGISRPCRARRTATGFRETRRASPLRRG